jgi:hypothetical protein
MRTGPARGTSTTDRKGVIMNRNGRVSFCLIVLVLVSCNAFAQGTERTEPVTKEEVETLLDRLEKYAVEGSKGSFDVGECWHRLASAGDLAVEMIAKRLETVKDRRVIRLLVVALGQIPGEKSIPILRKIAFDERYGEDPRWNALICLGERKVRLDLGREEAIVLYQAILTGPYAISAAQILCGANNVSAKEKVSPLITRLIREAAAETKSYPPSHFTERGYMAGEFLEMLKYVGEPSIQVIKELSDALDKTKDHHAIDWLVVARGALGDRAVVDSLCEIALDTGRDSELRFFAVKALPVVLGESSREMLTKLLSDEAEALAEENTLDSVLGTGKVKIVRMAARQSLSILDKRKEEHDTKREKMKSSINWLLPGLVIIGVAIAGAVIFLLVRRRKAP